MPLLHFLIIKKESKRNGRRAARGGRRMQVREATGNELSNCRFLFFILLLISIDQ
jgi:hypothetical protein